MTTAKHPSNATATPEAAQAQLPNRIEWRFLLAVLLPLGAIFQVLHDPSNAIWGVVVSWLLIAAIDHFLPGAQTSPAPVSVNALHVWVVRMHVPAQLGLMACAAWAASSADWPTVIGLAIMVGWVSGAQGITFAHELGHSKLKFDRFLGWVLMISIWYAHFMVEHYRGHHPRAATFEDPASSRRGESFYAFWPRTVVGCFTSAWQLEAQRLKQWKQGWLQSPLVWSFTLNLLLVAAFIGVGAIKIAVGWLVASVVAFSLLELVNYIEHYGLQRQFVTNAAGKTAREPFAPPHAWNANHWLTNALLVNLQRHSDHHTRAWKPFATLEHSPAPCPQLPTGYAGSILLALVPPLWFKVMNARLDALASNTQK